MKVFTGLLVLTFFTGHALACSEHDTAADVQQILKSQKLNTVQTSRGGEKLVLVDEEVATPEDAVRVSQLLEGVRKANAGTTIQNLVKVSPEGWNGLAARIEREIASPEIRVSVKGTSLVLEGDAENEFVADRAVEITRSNMRAFSPERVQTTLSILDMLRLKSPAQIPGLKKASR